MTTQFETLTQSINAIAVTTEGAKNLTVEQWDEMREHYDDYIQRVAERIDNIDGSDSGSSFWGDLIGAGVLGSAISTGIETQGALKKAVAETAASKVDAIADSVSNAAAGADSGLKAALETANAARVAMNAVITGMKQQVHGMVSTVANITTTANTINNWGDSKGRHKDWDTRLEDNTEYIYELQTDVQAANLGLGALKHQVEEMDTNDTNDETDVPVDQEMVAQHEKQIEQLITVIGEMHKSVEELKRGASAPSMNVTYTSGTLLHR